MRFGLIHRIMTDTLAVLGVLALVTSGKLHPLATGMVIVGLLLGVFLPQRLRQEGFIKLLGVVGPLSILTVQVLRLSLGANPIPIVVEFAAGLQVIRLATRRGAAHDHQVILLSLLHLIAGTVLGGGLTYAVALLGFLIFTPGALVLSHLRREVEGNYRQGARDRTGMPVDVPRILRSRRVIGRGFLLFTCSLSVPVFLFSAFLFLLFPRVGFAWLSVPRFEPSRVVGFSDRVDLGGVGTIRTDPTLVMRVTPSDLGETPPLRRNLYLRGAVFDSYDGRAWSRSDQAETPPVEYSAQVILRRHPKPGDRTMLIDLDRIDPPVVFLPGESVSLQVLSVDRDPRGFSSVVQRDSTGQLRYASRKGEGLRYRVHLPPRGLIVPERSDQLSLRRYLQVPRSLSPRVRRLARELAQGQNQPLEIARALERRLRKDYRYDLGSPAGAAADPLDHFLFESKSGHCEFYSTAMAMMLRLNGVPSRNVTGFVGGTFNRFASFYAVRQGDAHSWVEAYLPERGWIRFDPTPPSNAAPQARAQGMFSVVRELVEAASQSWRQNVVGFDMRKQLSLVRRMKNWMKNTGVTAAPGQSALAGSKWLWLALAVLLGGIAYAWARLRRAPTPRAEPVDRSAEQSIELYRRLESALSARGVPRPLSTPPLAHARALAAAGHPVGVEALRLTRLYLRARFGKQPLSEQEVSDFQAVASALRRPAATEDAA